MASCALAAEDYLDNGVIKLGIELTKGGSITYLSISGTTNNIVNDHDLGRQIQQSYYSGPQPYNPSNNVNPVWTNWPWNLIYRRTSTRKVPARLAAPSRAWVCAILRMRYPPPREYRIRSASVWPRPQ